MQLHVRTERKTIFLQIVAKLYVLALNESGPSLRKKL